jgi:hypothetical protein
MPEYRRGELISFTSSCIKVRCLNDADGETWFTLGAYTDLHPKTALRFEGFLETPNRKIAIRTVELSIVLEVDVPTTRTYVRIWANDESEPDDVIVGFGL